MAGCAVDECAGVHVARGYCDNHYRQVQRNGRTTKGHRRPGALARRDGLGRKECTGCLDWLPGSSYSSDTAKVDGLRTRCRDCDVRARRARMYGLDREAFIALLEGQGGRCAGCGTSEPGGKRGEWAIDHDHACCPHASKTCGRCVRGLLCNHCNLVLGHTKDNPEVLRTLASYLEGVTS